MQPELKRETFKRVINQSLADFLNQDMDPENYDNVHDFLFQPREFDPLDTPNRVPGIVSNRLWMRLLGNHLESFRSN